MIPAMKETSGVKKFVPSVWVSNDEFYETRKQYGSLGLVILCRLLESETSKLLCVKWDDGSYTGAVESEREAFKALRSQGFKYLGRL